MDPDYDRPGIPVWAIGDPEVDPEEHDETGSGQPN